jgi:hypothetical protein
MKISAKVYPGTYWYVQMGYRLVYTRMRTFQVKFILVHERTSPVDLVYTLLGHAGSRESRTIAALMQAEIIYCFSAGAVLRQPPAA